MPVETNAEEPAAGLPIPAVLYVRQIEYDESGYAWTEERFDRPSWELVEELILRLDSFRRPILWLHLDPDPNDGRSMQILGGTNLATIYISTQSDHLQFFDPDGSSEEVVIWSSDQGYSDYAFHTLRNVATIASIARHYYLKGKADPSCGWV